MHHRGRYLAGRSSFAEKFLQKATHFRNVDGRDLPHNPRIHGGVIVGDDVTHASHFTVGEFGDVFAGLPVEMGGGFADDLDAPNDGILSPSPVILTLRLSS